MVQSRHKPPTILKPCVICDYQTKNRFNINFNSMPICEECANAITIQQVTGLIHLPTAGR